MGKKIGFSLLTQDKAEKQKGFPVSWGNFHFGKKAIFVPNQKNNDICLHKKIVRWKRGKVENRMGQGVFHSFHRVFHNYGGNHWLREERMWKTPATRLVKKEFFCNVWKKIPENGYSCRTLTGNRGFWPIPAAFLFEIFGNLCYNYKNLCLLAAPKAHLGKYSRQRRGRML